MANVIIRLPLNEALASPPTPFPTIVAEQACSKFPFFSQPVNALEFPRTATYGCCWNISIIPPVGQAAIDIPQLTFHYDWWCPVESQAVGNAFFGVALSWKPSNVGVGIDSIFFATSYGELSSVPAPPVTAPKHATITMRRSVTTPPPNATLTELNGFGTTGTATGGWLTVKFQRFGGSPFDTLLGPARVAAISLVYPDA